MAKDRGELNYIWKDRKRILGMPISFTRYMLSQDRLFLETGLFNSHYDEILLYRIRDIGMKRSLGQKIFSVGSVMVKSSDKTLPDLELKNIKDPLYVKETLHKLVEENKLSRRMRVAELMGDDLGDEDDDALDQDIE
ncbi:MAG: PH domain-containing protein [Clostridiales bacterium]|nr:PH domain-containing protein [Clostridiales bacterium]